MKPTTTALLLVLALTACIPVAPRRPPPALHDFGPLPPTAAHGSKSVTVTAPPWLQDTRLRYRLLFDDPTRVRFYADHRWLAPLPALLAQRLASLPVPLTYRLQAHLLDLEQVFDTPTRSRIVLRFLIEAAGADGRVVAARLFSFDQLTPSASVQGAVAAYAKAVAQALEDVCVWLEDLSADRQTASSSTSASSWSKGDVHRQDRSDRLGEWTVFRDRLPSYALEPPLPH